MPRPLRLHREGGYYHVALRSTGEAPLFLLPEEWPILETNLRRSIARCDVRIHAAAAFPRALHLALQISGVSVSRFVQHFAAAHARAVNSRRNTLGALFAPHHHAMLIEPGEWLLPLVRYIHWTPVLQGVTASPEDHPFSTHHAYLGTRTFTWVTAADVLGTLSGDPPSARRLYREFTSAPPPRPEVDALTLGSRRDRRVLGGAKFLAELPPVARRYRAARTLADLVAQVVRNMYITEAELSSRSKRRDLVLARAVLAFHATIRGDVALAEVARYLRRDPSTLSEAIDRYRRIYPTLFRAGGLESLPSVRDQREGGNQGE